MMPLGTRVVEVPTLEDRIAARLTVAADAADRAGILPPAAEGRQFGLAVEGDPNSYPMVLLPLGDVARIAAQEARAWF